MDTTSLFADPALRSAQWREVLSAAAAGRVMLCVPEVVLREARRHFAKIIRKAGKNLTDGYGALRQHGVSLSGAPSEDIRAELEAQLARYDEGVRERLAAVGAVILPLPHVALEEVLDRDLDARKPFDDKGKGFRDTLIWMSIVEYASTLPEGDTLVVVTNNSEDFGTGSLAHELLEDLASAGVSDGVVTLVSDLPECLAKIPARREREVDASIADGASLSDRVAPAISALCGTLVGGDVATYYEQSGLPFDDHGIPSELDDPTIYYIDPDFDSLDIQVIEEFQQTTVLVEATVEAVVIIDGFMYKADYYGVDNDVEILDPDWNSHMMWVSVERTFQLTFSARVELSSGVEDIELVSMEAHG